MLSIGRFSTACVGRLPYNAGRDATFTRTSRRGLPGACAGTSPCVLLPDLMMDTLPLLSSSSPPPFLSPYSATCTSSFHLARNRGQRMVKQATCTVHGDFFRPTLCITSQAIGHPIHLEAVKHYYFDGTGRVPLFTAVAPQSRLPLLSRTNVIVHPEKSCTGITSGYRNPRHVTRRPSERSNH